MSSHFLILILLNQVEYNAVLEEFFTSAQVYILQNVGCDNNTLRSSPAYVGQQLGRLRGAEYDAVVEEF